MPVQSLERVTMYHIAKDGTPKPCRASTRTCPLGNGKHFESSEAAYKALLDGTAKLPKYPKMESKGHTMNSMMYHADDNRFQLLTRAEAPVPNDYFVVSAKHDGLFHKHIFEGFPMDGKAKLVGHITNDMRGNVEMYVGSTITGGQKVEGYAHFDNLMHAITGE